MGSCNIVSRLNAVRRGMEFLHRTARDHEGFEAYGHDFLLCFCAIGSTSRDPEVRKMALTMGRERAHHWRRQHSSVPSDADADAVANLVLGSDAADRLGVRDYSIKSKIRRAARQFSAQDYFWFNPSQEPPPGDVPEDCDCGANNPRGREACRKCRKPLTMMSRYEVWLVALIRSYKGERYNVPLGAPYVDVIKWLPAMRPYRASEDGNDSEFSDIVYAITHVVYTLNDYSSYNLSPGWLPAEFEFLESNLERAIAMEDPDMVGEFLDSLKSFGLSDNHPLINGGMGYLISQQNADGSWGDTDADDIYERYHPTWTAIDGLRDYAWRGKKLSFPELQPLLKGFASTT